MTDPTTRYPLPDDPGTDPLGAVGAAPPPPSTDAGAGSGSGASAPPPAPPATGWQPPRHDENRWPAVVFGLVLIVVGLWFFAETTLGLDLPTIRWGSLWPVILIVVGILVLYGSRLGRSR